MFKWKKNLPDLILRFQAKIVVKWFAQVYIFTLIYVNTYELVACIATLCMVCTLSAVLADVEPVSLDAGLEISNAELREGCL